MLARTSDDATKARVTARILLASDDATEAVLSQADTAGQAVRLWRIQRNIDADIDGLPDNQQQSWENISSETATMVRGSSTTSTAVTSDGSSTSRRPPVRR